MTTLFSTTSTYYHKEETSYEDCMDTLEYAKIRKKYTIKFNFAGQESGESDYLICPGSFLFVRHDKKEFTYVGQVLHIALLKEKRGKKPALYELEVSIRSFYGIPSGTQIKRNENATGNCVWKDSALLAGREIVV